MSTMPLGPEHRFDDTNSHPIDDIRNGRFGGASSSNSNNDNIVGLDLKQTVMETTKAMSSDRVYENNASSLLEKAMNRVILPIQTPSSSQSISVPSSVNTINDSPDSSRRRHVVSMMAVLATSTTILFAADRTMKHAVRSMEDPHTTYAREYINQQPTTWPYSQSSPLPPAPLHTPSMTTTVVVDDDASTAKTIEMLDECTTTSSTLSSLDAHDMISSSSSSSTGHWPYSQSSPLPPRPPSSTLTSTTTTTTTLLSSDDESHLLSTTPATRGTISGNGATSTTTTTTWPASQTSPLPPRSINNKSNESLLSSSSLAMADVSSTTNNNAATRAFTNDPLSAFGQSLSSSSLSSPTSSSLSFSQGLRASSSATGSTTSSSSSLSNTATDMSRALNQRRRMINPRTHG
jgi:hypothetical protein